jgi:hypothetical protein
MPLEFVWRLAALATVAVGAWPTTTRLGSGWRAFTEDIVRHAPRQCFQAHVHAQGGALVLPDNSASGAWDNAPLVTPSEVLETSRRVGRARGSVRMCVREPSVCSLAQSVVRAADAVQPHSSEEVRRTVLWETVPPAAKVHVRSPRCSHDDDDDDAATGGGVMWLWGVLGESVACAVLH